MRKPAVRFGQFADRLGLWDRWVRAWSMRQIMSDDVYYVFVVCYVESLHS